MPRHNIIAIDDFSMNLLIIKNALDDLANIYTVKSASAAMLTLNKLKNVSLILLDLEMPDVSGFEFLEYLRTSPVYSDLPVIIISSNSKIETIKKAINFSINDYITKPFDNETLRKKVSRVLGIK